jgi:hypothetical protein
MPVVARFYGVIINIQTLEMMEGDLPLRAQRLVTE